MRSASGSRLSPRAVEPTMSLNSTVTVRRDSCPVVVSSASRRPHSRQNRARSGLSVPQFGQAGMIRATAGGPRTRSGRRSRPIAAERYGTSHQSSTFQMSEAVDGFFRKFWSVAPIPRASFR